MSQAHFVLLTSASCTSSWRSVPVDLYEKEGAAFQFALSGTVSGTLELQVSNDEGTRWKASMAAPPSLRTYDIVNWTSITSPTTTVTAISGGQPNNVFINYSRAYARWVRTVFSASQGSNGFCQSVMVSTKGPTKGS